MHDATADANRGALIDGRSEFTQAVRRSLAQAHRQRLRELCFVGTNFEVWPLDDAEAMAGEFEVADHFRVEQTHGVGGDRIAETGMELLGDRGATGDRVLLKHHDPQAGAGEIGRAGQSIVAAADEGDVVVV